MERRIVEMELSETARLIRDAAAALVDRPENVRIGEVVATDTTVLELHVGGGEYGRVIGRGGRVADAFRELLKAIGGRQKRRLEILFNGGVANPDDRPVRVNIGSVPETFQADTAALLERLVKAVVDDPAGVVVETISGSQVTVYEVRVSGADYPRVLGRQGRLVDSLRAVLVSLGARAGRCYVLELVDPRRRRGGTQDPG
jgi:hypothetical protein